MSTPIENYALIGDTETAALVDLGGSIDWLCVPRFDSGACFAALLGGERNGRWRLAPAGEVRHVRRRYRPCSMVLETEFVTRSGTVRVTDCMPVREKAPQLVRVVEGLKGRVAMEMELIIRFDYGSIVPWVRSYGGALHAVAGADALCLRSDVETQGKDLTTVAAFDVDRGARARFVLSWHPSHRRAPPPLDARRALRETDRWWRRWCGSCKYRGPWRDAVLRSLMTLKTLTYWPTGGVVAAPTTSLPEKIGGVRNWDYRYCWLRDATFTLYALLSAGFTDEARAWRDWLLRAVAGDPSRLQILYGLAGERRMTEQELPWLEGYGRSRPVRIGNDASRQVQIDVYGEVLDTLQLASTTGLAPDPTAWALQRVLLGFLEKGWRKSDHGIWETRGPRRPFTHSRVMAWVAFDRAVKAVERSGLPGPVDRWRATRDKIHREVCSRGYDAQRGTFTQYYGSREVDASLLLIPLVGFLPPDDDRVRGTVEAIERRLMWKGFLKRYETGARESRDGLPPGEGVFLPCTFWLADTYRVMGRRAEARRLFKRLLAIRNDVGLLSEEYDPVKRRLLGNFPQAFSHVALVNTAFNLSPGGGPAHHRPRS
jgi:GH15 family glucan-1,4-alpha-glucosidase